MAKESVKILQGKLDVESLISQLNAALAEEWLAYYQLIRCCCPPDIPRADFLSLSFVSSHTEA